MYNNDYIFLDDLREIKEVYYDNTEVKFIILRSFDDFKEYIDNLKSKNTIPKYISFDHDLGIGKTGFDCAKYLIEYMMDQNITTKIEYYVHSANPIGKQNIISIISNFNNFNKM